jgi:uncharacterized protein YihD (DUF1040 family)
MQYLEDLVENQQNHDNFQVLNLLLSLADSQGYQMRKSDNVDPVIDNKLDLDTCTKMIT